MSQLNGVCDVLWLIATSFYSRQLITNTHLYRYTVNSVVYLINTPTNAHIFI